MESKIYQILSVMSEVLNAPQLERLQTVLFEQFAEEETQVEKVLDNQDYLELLES